MSPMLRDRIGPGFRALVAHEPGQQFRMGVEAIASRIFSQAARIIANTLTDGDPEADGVAYRSTYEFDAAARLIQATLAVNGDTDHVLGYSFTDHSACTMDGAVANAGLNGNRTAYTDTHFVEGVPTTSTTRYCYDRADRLLGS